VQAPVVDLIDDRDSEGLHGQQHPASSAHAPLQQALQLWEQAGGEQQVGVRKGLPQLLSGPGLYLQLAWRGLPQLMPWSTLAWPGLLAADTL
jgi:hypothetical protein